MNCKAILGADQHSCCLLENDKTIVTDTHGSSGESAIKSTCPPFYVCGSVAQSSLTLCDHMDYSPPDSSVHGISQARRLEWVAISFSITPRVTPRVALYCSARIHARISKGKGTWGEIHKKPGLRFHVFSREAT